METIEIIGTITLLLCALLGLVILLVGLYHVLK